MKKSCTKISYLFVPGNIQKYIMIKSADFKYSLEHKESDNDVEIKDALIPAWIIDVKSKITLTNNFYNYWKSVIFKVSMRSR